MQADGQNTRVIASLRCAGKVMVTSAESEIGETCSNSGLVYLRSLPHRFPWERHTSITSPSRYRGYRMVDSKFKWRMTSNSKPLRMLQDKAKIFFLENHI